VQQLREHNVATVLAPAGRDIPESNGPRLVHVLASDHNIALDDAYLTAIDTAAKAARDGRLATFGITPTAPATGFGYVEAGEKEPSGARFVEKPNEDRAKEMIAQGNYYWNSGMFLFDSAVFLSECRALAPDVLNAAEASVKTAREDLDFIRLGEAEFAASPDISVDYAIFEKTALASVVPSPIRWSDLGAWDAVGRKVTAMQRVT
jgi:mannose-1-phosphate guanylyltransferase